MVLSVLVLLAASGKSHAQTFLNGSFEKHTATADQINLSNPEYNSIMENSYAFGDCPTLPGLGNMDIITSSTYCGAPQQPGNWYVALTQGGTDAISLTLSAPLVAGNEYTMSFYDRTCYSNPYPFQIGLSAVKDDFGTLIYSPPNATNVWTQHTFTFTAPNNGSYITVQLGGPSSCYSYWAQVDHFEMDTCSLDLDLGKDTTLCVGETYLLDATTQSATYLWHNNSTNPTFQVTKPGTYWVQVTDSCTSVRDSINVGYRTKLTLDLADTTLCEGETLLLDVATAGGTYLWHNGSVSSTFEVTKPGTYWVQVSDGCNSVSDAITVSYLQN